jgi:hypothetical protein
MELVKGEKQLLAGRRCPRCLSVQWHIRRVRAFRGEAGDVFMYSCLGCKKVIALETIPADPKESHEHAIEMSSPRT